MTTKSSIKVKPRGGQVSADALEFKKQSPSLRDSCFLAQTHAIVGILSDVLRDRRVTCVKTNSGVPQRKRLRSRNGISVTTFFTARANGRPVPMLAAILPDRSHRPWLGQLTVKSSSSQSCAFGLQFFAQDWRGRCPWCPSLRLVRLNRSARECRKTP